MILKRLSIAVSSLCMIMLVACCDTKGPGPVVTDNFDRELMLTQWAEELIIPSFIDYTDDLAELESKKDAFILDGNHETLAELRSAWLNSYKSWQKVSLYDIGRAESIGLRNFTNIYPTNTEAIESNVENGTYNLELPSTFATQGFPALDYLLFGIGESDDSILTIIQTTKYLNYLDALVTRLNSLANEVLSDWQTDFKVQFIANNGGSGTASVDKLVNDYLFYFEKFLRAGKIGIPAGIFSGNTISTAVEAPYSGDYSRELFEAGLTTVIDFFNGKNQNGSFSDNSLKTYLEYMQDQNELEEISFSITTQFQKAKETAAGLENNLKTQVETDNIKMLSTYDELQKLVVLMKVDMMQALNIQVDYVDADGD